MKFHIVQMNETIDEIIFLYNLTKDELKEENRHIRKWDKLIPGTKLKIPVITETIESEISEMEPFIEDYYPKLKEEENYEVIEEKEVFSEIKEEISDDKNEKEIHEEKPIENSEKKEVVSEKKVNYPYYKHYYPYYYYTNYRVPYPLYYYPVYYRKK